MFRNRYEIQGDLGTGGMGTVHSALDRLTGQVVALKRVRLYLGHDDVTFNLFSTAINDLRVALLQEFRLLASLRHPHIISVLDYGFDDSGQPYYTMTRLLDATNIISAGESLPPADRVRLLRQVLQALVYLHRHGILHRDLKPGNVLVTNSHARVLDFGLSSTMGEGLEAVGTWEYLAPELLDNGQVTEASDLYGVGLIAYEMFAGRPLIDRDQADLVDQVLHRQPDFSGLGVDPSLADIFERLLAKKPAARFQRAQEVINALDDWLGETNRADDLDIRESFLQAARFVGRRAERRQLRQAFGDAMGGHGSAWLISGESGVGKSRLVEEMRIEALVRGARVVRGQALHEHGLDPFSLWRDVIRRLLITTSLQKVTLAVLRQIIPDIEDLLGRPLPTPSPLQGPARRQRLIDTVTALFKEQQDGWTLLILEDIHLALDTLDLLERLQRLASEIPLVILATFRDDEAPDLGRRLTRMRHLPLPRLSPKEIAELSESMLGPSGRGADLLGFLQRESEGNAFFLVEVVRALAERAGRLNAVDPKNLPDRLFPDGIASIVSKRLEQVSPQARPLLLAAAVAGRQLDLPVLDHLRRDSKTPLDLELWLTTCADAAVFEMHEDRWRFAHEKIRDGLLQQLPSAERRQLHRRLAEVIELLYPNDPAQAGTLAHHWRRVGDEKKERHYAATAGHFARRQFANLEAINFLTRAIALTPAAAYMERFELFAAREQVYNLLGRRDEQQHDLKQMAALADHMAVDGHGERRSLAALRLAQYAETVGDFPAAIAAAEQALELASYMADAANQAAAHLAWGKALLRQGYYELSQQRLATSLESAQQHRLAQVEADAHRLLGIAAMELGQYEEAEGRYRQALARNREIQDRKGEATVQNNLGNLYHLRGDASQSLIFWEQAQILYDQIGDREGTSRVLTNLSSVYMELADYDSALHLGQMALAICQEIDVPLGTCINLLNLGLLEHYRGRLMEAAALAEEGVDLAETLGVAPLQASGRLILGSVLSDMGEVEAAETALASAQEKADHLGQTPLMAEIRTERAQLAFDREDLPELRRLLDTALELIAIDPSLSGSLRPFRMFDLLLEILRILGDRRLSAVLAHAYRLLQERSERISDLQQRANFLEKIDTHRRIIAEYRQFN